MIENNLWFFIALLSAVFWGISYCFAERIMDQGVSPAFLLLLQGIVTFPVYIIFAYFSNTLGTSLGAFDNTKIIVLTAVTTIALVLGNLLILTSIDMKNATLANLVEISYPLFTFLIAWTVFKDVQLSWSTAFGGLLILAGVGVIWMKH